MSMKIVSGTRLVIPDPPEETGEPLLLSGVAAKTVTERASEGGALQYSSAERILSIGFRRNGRSGEEEGR